MQFSTYQPVDLIFKLIVPEKKIFPFLDRRQKAFGAVKIILKEKFIHTWHTSSLLHIF